MVSATEYIIHIILATALWIHNFFFFGGGGGGGGGEGDPSVSPLSTLICNSYSMGARDLRCHKSLATRAITVIYPI